jgi:haloacid dehalogenase-like hydrolase
MTRALFAFLILLPISLCVSAQPDPLPSWNDGASKRAILKFVDAATRNDSRELIAPEDRIAVFDNDGTLWSEQPMYFQFAFMIDRVRELSPRHPEWKSTQPFAAVLAGDTKGVLASGEKGLLELLAVTHAGMTTEEFSRTVSDWMTHARHPRFGRRHDALVFQPMIELLTFLRLNGFKTYIVSGGGLEFMRPWASKVYGIPPEQFIGSSGKLEYELRNGEPVLIKLADVDFIDDKEGKPVGIQKFIGRVPVFAFGNSDGDLQMLQWTCLAEGLRFCGIVHHTDEAREWAYDRASHVGTLDQAWDEAKENGWTVVDMKSEWKRIYPWER